MLINLFQAAEYGVNSPVFRAVLIQLLLSLPVFLFSLSFHEAGHAFAANRCGDHTALMLGRLTLNPVKHLDLWGTILLFTVGFGWAKPVPVNPRNFRNYRRDDFFVSIAGILCNLLLMIFGALAFFFLQWFVLAQHIDNQMYNYVFQMLSILITLNLTLAFFNLLPVPPLDGYHLFNDLFLRRPLFAPQVAQRVGQGLLMLLVFSGAIGWLLTRVHSFVLGGIDTMMNAAFHALGLL